MINLLKASLYTISILWAAWLIFKSNNLFDSYITVIVLLLSMIFNDLLDIKDN